VADINVRPGDVITAKLLMEIANAPAPAAGIRGGGGILTRQTSGGQVQIAAKFTGLFVGTASGTISARSGSTMGSGSIELQVKDPSSGNYVDTGIALTCDNLSSTTGGIPTGAWCAGFFQDDGTPLITTVDCGN
jgi:hypothetical protein